jgi:Arc/MetJ-type ribon-helix-helix transcriptional regulator
MFAVAVVVSRGMLAALPAQLPSEAFRPRRAENVKPARAPDVARVERWSGARAQHAESIEPRPARGSGAAPCVLVSRYLTRPTEVTTMASARSATTITIPLTKSLREFLDIQVQAGLGKSISDYVVRFLKQEQRAAEDALEARLLASLDSGAPIPMTKDYWAKKRAALLARHGKRRPPAS